MIGQVTIADTGKYPQAQEVRVLKGFHDHGNPPPIQKPGLLQSRSALYLKNFISKTKGSSLVDVL